MLTNNFNASNSFCSTTLICNGGMPKKKKKKPHNSFKLKLNQCVVFMISCLAELEMDQSISLRKIKNY